MMKVWVQVNSSEPTQISIEGSKNIDDFCHAIKEALPKFSKVGVNVVIKSHEDIKLARNVLISNLHWRQNFTRRSLQDHEVSKN